MHASVTNKAAIAILACVLALAAGCYDAPGAPGYAAIDASMVDDTEGNGYSKYILTRSIEGRQGNMEIKGSMPFANGMKNSRLQSLLNERFNSQYNGFLSSADDNTERITLSFEVIESGAYLSVVFKCVQSAASNVENIATTVVDTATPAIINITGVTVNGSPNINGVKLANSRISALIKANPSAYNPNFTEITASHGFYIKGGNLILTFDAYELMPGSSAQEVSMSLTDILNVTVASGDYYNQPPEKYSVRMVQLRQVTEPFGYSLRWTAADKGIDIYKSNVITATLRIGVNSYAAGRNPARELECAPEIYTDDRAYVPISFYGEILGLCYTVDSTSGDIVFSAYMGK